MANSLLVGSLRRKGNRMLPLLSFVALVACTRTCVGFPEVGSKRSPVRLFLASQTPIAQDELRKVEQCLETESQYRVQFEVAADERAVVSALGRGEAHLAYLTPMNYIAAASKFDVKALRVRLESGSPVNRSVIVGKGSLWESHFEKHHIPRTVAGIRSESAMSLLSEGRFLFADPESDVGFFVPRHLLFLRDIFPKEAAFAGNDELVVQGLERGLATAGAVSESWLRQKYQVAQVLGPGVSIGPLWVLDVSPSLPGKVIASKADFSNKILDKILVGLEVCSARNAAKAVGEVFGGEGFGMVSERMFAYARELRDSQETFLRAVEPLER